MPGKEHSRDYFSWLLAAITIAALIPRLLLGISQFIHYDGYWHVFIATQDRWRLFIFEWKGDAHPPLYYLLLRLVTKLGRSHLIYRSLSIIPGVATVYILGQVAKRLFRNKLLALLAAAAYGFSITIIELTIDVRGYPLALFFLACAFYYFTDFLLTGKSPVLFGILLSLAIATEYYSVLLLVACIAALTLYRRFPRRLIDCFGMLVLPCTVTLVLYLAHMRGHPIAQNDVLGFYWTRGTPLSGFILNGLQQDLNYLSPVELGPSAAFCSVLAAGFGAIFFASRKKIVAALPLVLCVLVAELIVLSLMRLYPFGGYARQQSILFPFLILTAFGLLDWLISYLRPSIRAGVLALAAVSIAASFAYRWEKFPKTSQELFTQEYNSFQAALSHSSAIYVDQFSLIAYSIHTHDWSWRFQQHYRAPERVDTYQITDPAGRQLILLRNIDEWNFNLLNAGFYSTLAKSMQSAGVTRASLFFVKQFQKPMDAATVESNERAIQALAKQFGLTADVHAYSGGEAFVELEL